MGGMSNGTSSRFTTADFEEGATFMVQPGLMKSQPESLHDT
jgi:hypothetical protein